MVEEDGEISAFKPYHSIFCSAPMSFRTISVPWTLNDQWTFFDEGQNSNFALVCLDNEKIEYQKPHE